MFPSSDLTLRTNRAFFALRGSSINLVLDLSACLIPNNSIFSFFRSNITTVTVDCTFLAIDQLRKHRYIMHVCAGYFHMMCQSGILIYANMGFLSEVPGIALFHRMSFRIPFLFSIFRGGWGCNQCRIYNRSFFQNQFSLRQQIHHLLKQLFL